MFFLFLIIARAMKTERRSFHLCGNKKLLWGYSTSRSFSSAQTDQAAPRCAFCAADCWCLCFLSRCSVLQTAVQNQSAADKNTGAGEPAGGPITDVTHGSPLQDHQLPTPHLSHVCQMITKPYFCISASMKGTRSDNLWNHRRYNISLFERQSFEASVFF